MCLINALVNILVHAWTNNEQIVSNTSDVELVHYNKVHSC